MAVEKQEEIQPYKSASFIASLLNYAKIKIEGDARFLQVILPLVVTLPLLIKERHLSHHIED